MKRLPLIIILLGLMICGAGIWQLIDAKVQTSSALEKAKKAITQKSGEQVNKKADSGSNRQLPNIGEMIGILDIPKINAELAIVEGTNPDDLTKGVGHYKGSYLPGDNGQIVLSGHRDTVFRHLGELKIGDLLNLEMPYGKYHYEITHMKIVDADDTSIITLQNQEEELILTTCYPFRYVGNAPKRYIIYAKPSGS